MARVEDCSVIVLCSLVQAVAAGFAVSHLRPETKGEPMAEGPQAEARLQGASHTRPLTGAVGPALGQSQESVSLVPRSG